MKMTIQIKIKDKKVIEYIKNKQKELTDKHNLNPNIKFKINKCPMYKVIEEIVKEVI